MGEHLDLSYISGRSIIQMSGENTVLKYELSRRFAILAFLFAAALLANKTLAHEMGTTRVETFLKRDATFEIHIVVDPENLLARLEASAGRPLSGPLPPAEQATLINSLESEYLEHIALEFGGARVLPEFHYRPLPASAPDARLGMVLLSGAIPPQAKSFRFSYDLLYTAYTFVVHDEGKGQSSQQLVEAGSWSPAVELSEITKPRSRSEVAWQYLKLGFTHILPKGLDHILFVLGIFLLSPRLKWIVAQVTAFTIAHSITLGLTIYGFVSLSPRIVEPLIALSIVYVAVENVITSELKPWRVAVVFLFGLLHGMGFAGVLSELGLPRSEFFTALVTFNVGVEAGQLTVIALAALLLGQWFRDRAWYRRRVVIPVSLAIAATGLYWTIQRTFLETS